MMHRKMPPADLPSADAAPVLSSGLRVASIATCAAIAHAAPMLADVANGRPPGEDAATLAAYLAAAALEVLQSLELPPFWRGYLGGIDHAIDGILAAPGVQHSARPALDVERAGAACLAVVAIARDADTLDGAP